MPLSTQTWIPYATKDNPLLWPDLPEWDSILISNIQIPIAEIPQYSRHIARQRKRGPGQNNQKLTQKGMQPPPIKITLLLWVDVSGVNYLDLYRTLAPIIVPDREDKRFALPVYHPVLESFGVTSIEFTNASTPRHVGGLLFHAELEGDNGADIKSGQSTNITKKPDTNALSATPGYTRGGRFGVATQTIPRVDGTSQTQAWQGRINTPSSRSGVP